MRNVIDYILLMCVVIGIVSLAITFAYAVSLEVK